MGIAATTEQKILQKNHSVHVRSEFFLGSYLFSEVSWKKKKNNCQKMLANYLFSYKKKEKGEKINIKNSIIFHKRLKLLLLLLITSE